MGVSDNIKVIRGDISNMSQNLFIFFFKKFPNNLQYFPDYVGKSIDSLRSVPSFPIHSQKVVTLMLEIAEKASSPEAITADADKLVKMQEHAPLGTKQFEELFAALVPFLSEKLGASCDKAGWEAVGRHIVTALTHAGM